MCFILIFNYILLNYFLIIVYSVCVMYVICFGFVFLNCNPCNLYLPFLKMWNKTWIELLRDQLHLASCEILCMPLIICKLLFNFRSLLMAPSHDVYCCKWTIFFFFPFFWMFGILIDMIGNLVSFYYILLTWQRKAVSFNWFTLLSSKDSKGFLAYGLDIRL